METEGQEPAVPTEGQTPTPNTESEPKTFDEQYVKTLRSEAASLRTKLKSFETEAENRKTAAMSEMEKAQKAAQDADARATATEQRLAKRDALDALRSANIVDPDLAYMAIKDSIVLENGEPKNIADLVSQFVADRPAMVKATEPAAPKAPATKSTNPSPPNKAVTPSKYVGRL